ncbi:MAG: hypothetical protein WCK89_16035 [bacterium]
MTKPKQTLYLAVQWPYIAVREACDSNNIGAIEKKHYGGGYPGTLNFTQVLLVMTATQLTALGHAKKKGNMRRGGGTNYEGWIDFGTIRKAIEFLKLHANISFCSITGVIVCEGGRLIPLPHKNSCHRWTALMDAIKRATHRGLQPSRVVFRKGKWHIPRDFVAWCEERGIEIVLLDDYEFDNRYPLPDLSGDLDDLPPWMDEEGHPLF